MLGLTCLLIVCLISPALSIYEDQVGSVEWFRENIGRVGNAIFDDKSHTIHVSTYSNVIASLHSSGTIAWRQVLPESDNQIIDHPLLDYFNGQLMSISNLQQGGSIVRLWNKRSLQLEESLEGSFVDAKFIRTTSPDIALLSSSSIELRSSKDAKLIWSLALADHGITNPRFIFQESMSSKLIVIGDSGIIAIDKSGGTVSRSISFDSKLSNFDSFVLSSQGYLLSLDQSSSNLIVYYVASETDSTLSLSSIALPSPSSSVFASSASSRIVVYAQKSRQASTLLLSGKSNPKIDAITSVQVPINDSTPIDNVFVSDGSAVSLVALSDWTVMQLDSNGKQSWVREESLASINQIEAMELPSRHVSELSELEEEFDQHGIVSRFLRRIKLQHEHLLSYFSDQAFDLLSTAEHDMTKDRFGFRKLIVALTKSGKLVAIHSSQGKIVWSKNLAASHFYLSRTSAYYPPELIVITESHILTVDPLTGESTGSHPLPLSPLVQIIPLPFFDHSHRRVFALITSSSPSNHGVALHPDTPESRQLVMNSTEPIYYYLVDPSSGSVTGHSISRSATSSLAWSVQLGVPIVSVASAHPHEHIHSPAVILGDRSLLAKYLNRNIVALASLDFDTVHYHLLDTVTGSIVFHTFHQSASSPISMALTENSFLYSYYSTKTSKNIIGSVDLFNSDVDWSGTSGHQFSSFSSPHPSYHFHQTYMIPLPIKHLQTTVTQKGITSRHLIISTATDQVISLDLKFVNPRRPQTNTPTQAEKDEGLIPYKPYLPLHPHFFLTFNRHVPRLVQSYTSPTTLESTALIISLGLDQFCTRTAPSEGYDLLNPDFNYFALLSTCIVLVVGTIVTSRIAKKRDMTRQWK